MKAVVRSVAVTNSPVPPIFAGLASVCLLILAFSCASTKDIVTTGFAYDERAQFAEAHSYAWKAELNDDGDRASNLQVARTMFDRLSSAQHAGTEGELSLAVLETHIALAEAAATGAQPPVQRIKELASRAKKIEPDAPQTILLTSLSLQNDQTLGMLESAAKASKLDTQGSLRLVVLYRNSGKIQDALLLLDNLTPSIDKNLADAFSKTRSTMIAALESGVKNAIEARFAALSETKKQDLMELLAKQPWTQLLAGKKPQDLLLNDGDLLLLRRNLAWFCTQLLLSYPRQERLRKDWQIWLDGADARAKVKARPSSIPDISMDDDYWFAVARAVERAVMTLPDGKNFEGLRAASGVEVLQALKALAALAPKDSDPSSDL